MKFWASIVTFLLVNELHQSKAAKLYDAAEAAAIEEIENMSAKELLNLAQTVAESEELMEARQIRKKRGVTHLAKKLLPGLAAAGVLNTVGLGALVGKAGLVGGAAKVIGAKLNGAGTLLSGTNPGGEAVATRSHSGPASKSRKKRGGLHLLGHGVTHLAKKLLPGLAAAGVLNTVGLGALVGKATLVGGAAKLIGGKAVIGGAGAATLKGGTNAASEAVATPRNCKTTWEEHSEPHCSTTYEKKCETEYTTECSIEYTTECKTEHYEKCQTEHVQQCTSETIRQCTTEDKEECWEEVEQVCSRRPSCTTTQVEHCSTVHQRVCPERRWNEASLSRKKRGGLHLLGKGVTHLAKKLLPGLAAAGVINKVGLGALVGKAKLIGGKAAIGGATSTGGADARGSYTVQDDCHDVPHQQCTWEPVEKCHDVVECHDEPATWCKNVPHEKCWDEPHERCWDEPQEKCWDEPREKCWEEPHEKCWQEPHEKCWEVPHEHCEDVIVKVAKKWCEEEVWK
eukprot:GFUD01004252.1.p1 GENE.GFUD01004252.1~~GFUD01004252.1.p1  ORF type:complete len:512 (+),score=59.19 GFUD01004252.1:36-1571(+)